MIAASLDDDKALEPVIIDLKGKTSYADYVIIASGQSARHVGSMANHISEKVKESGLKRPRVEGLPQCDWVLVDAGDVIVHLFRPEVRSFYAIEKMWGDPDIEPDKVVKSRTVRG